MYLCKLLVIKILIWFYYDLYFVKIVCLYIPHNQINIIEYVETVIKERGFYNKYVNI